MELRRFDVVTSGGVATSLMLNRRDAEAAGLPWDQPVRPVPVKGRRATANKGRTSTANKGRTSAGGDK